MRDAEAVGGSACDLEAAEDAPDFVGKRLVGFERERRDACAGHADTLAKVVIEVCHGGRCGRHGAEDARTCAVIDVRRGFQRRGLHNATAEEIGMRNGVGDGTVEIRSFGNGEIAPRPVCRILGEPRLAHPSSIPVFHGNVPAVAEENVGFRDDGALKRI